MPDSESNSTRSSVQTVANDSELKLIHSNRTVLPPVQLEAAPSSSRSILLTWKDPRLPEEKLAGFYIVCYGEVKLQQSCESGSNSLKR